VPKSSVRFDPDLADLPLADLGSTVSTLRRAVGAVSARFFKLSWWWQVGLIWAASRLYSLALVLTSLHNQPEVPFIAGKLSFLGYSSIWDAVYYEQIHDNGYPVELPRDQSGQVQGSVWAFLPVYPFLVRALTSLTGASWPVGALVVSLTASLGFVLLTYQLFRTRQDRGTSLVAVAVVSFTTAATVYSFAYAESLALLGLAAVLLLLTRGHYLIAAPLVVLVGLTRPMGVPLAVMCVLVAGLVVAGHRRAGESIRPGRLASLTVLVVAGLVAAGLWPAIAAAVTGVPNAYVISEAGWHGNIVFAPFQAFAVSFMAMFGVSVGVVVLCLAVIMLCLLFLSRPVRELGAVQWAWAGCWIGYLAAMVPLDTTWPRMLLAGFPLALAAVSLSRSRAYRTLLLLAAAISQAVWVFVLWYLTDGVLDSRP
jgi:hypothetical protein